jgi:DNA-binding NarL/FixJ family response regulator
MKPKAVVVDDSGPMRTAIKDLLAADGRCEVAGEGANGVEALALAREVRPDLVIMDLHMPVMGGLEALRLLKAEAPAIRVVLVTTALDPDVSAAALKDGALACLEKAPGLWEELVRLLATILEPRSSEAASV